LTYDSPLSLYIHGMLIVFSHMACLTLLCLLTVPLKSALVVVVVMVMVYCGGGGSSSGNVSSGGGSSSILAVVYWQ